MTVEELIDALMKINDKTIEVRFYCPRCKELSPLDSMKEFGFVAKKVN